MNRQDEYDIKIADYLDGEMDATSEEAFMQELNVDTALRQRYEQELQIRFLLQDAKADMPVSDSKGEWPLFRLKNVYWKVAAAIFLIVLVGAIAFWALQKKEGRKEEISTHSTPAAKDTAPVLTSTEKPPVTVSADSLFDRYYQAYRSETGPVEISLFYRQYSAKQYASVLEAVPEDYLLQGTNDRQNLLENYMNLYKGLSYIETGKIVKAKQFLKEILDSPAADNEALIAPARWYLALANLRLGNTDDCRKLLLLLAKQPSPYQKQAVELLAQLGKH